MNTPPEEYLSENEYDDIDDIDEEEEDQNISNKKSKKDKTIKRSLEEDDGDGDDDEEDDDDEELYEDEDEDEDDDINIDVDDDINNEEQQKKPEKKKVDFQKALNTISDDDLSDDDEYYDDKYYEKFDNELKENYIMKYHNNLLQHNYNEIETLSKITGRKMDNTINDSLHRTLPILTKYEKARVLGIRAKQIENGSLPLIEVDNDIIDAYLIAQKELNEKIPFIIKRPLPNGACEYWKLNDLELICD